MAELADAPDLGSGGRPWGFESLHPHKVLGVIGPGTFSFLNISCVSMLNMLKLGKLILDFRKRERRWIFYL